MNFFASGDEFLHQLPALVRGLNERRENMNASNMTAWMSSIILGNISEEGLTHIYDRFVHDLLVQQVLPAAAEKPSYHRPEVKQVVQDAIRLYKHKLCGGEVAETEWQAVIAAASAVEYLDQHNIVTGADRHYPAACAATAAEINHSAELISVVIHQAAEAAASVAADAADAAGMSINHAASDAAARVRHWAANHLLTLIREERTKLAASKAA